MTDDHAARLRAARAYARLERDALAAALGISVRTLGRLESGHMASTVEQRRTVAAATGVPEWFLEQGFHGATLDGIDPTVRDRVEALEGQLGTLRDQHSELREARRRIDALDDEVKRLRLGIVELSGPVGDARAKTTPAGRESPRRAASGTRPRRRPKGDS